jgi:hypothetical protein
MALPSKDDDELLHELFAAMCWLTAVAIRRPSMLSAVWITVGWLSLDGGTQLDG